MRWRGEAKVRWYGEDGEGDGDCGQERDGDWEAGRRRGQERKMESEVDGERRGWQGEGRRDGGHEEARST